MTPIQKKYWLYFFALLAFLLLTTTSLYYALHKNIRLLAVSYLDTLKSNDSDLLMVSRVIDGDTVELNDGSVIRYIGIDSPEKGKCYFEDSSKENKKLTLGKHVVIEKDKTDKDIYGRLLRYIWVDGVLINHYLVKNGFAKSYPYPPDTKYQTVFDLAQKNAKDGGLGLWSSCK